MGRRQTAGAATRYIAGELRAQKARLGLTYGQISEKSGVPKSNVDRMMGGKTGILVEYLVPVCVALDRDIPQLFKEAAEASGTE